MTLLRADTRRRCLQLGTRHWPMAIGKAGPLDQARKREGDDATPLGRFLCEALYYRPSRLGQLHCALPMHAITPQDGWCDDPSSGSYNRHIALPTPFAHEVLAREDRLYDALIVLSHNRWPAVPGYGSAIFLHIARETDAGLAPTRGCLALAQGDYLEMLARIGPRAQIDIF